MDERTKEQLKVSGDYTPTYWGQLKAQRGWTVEAHGQRHPPKRRQSVVEKERSEAQP